MAIKVSAQGSIPAINLDYIQYTTFKMSVSEVAPYRIAVSAVVRPYGVSGNVKYYAKENTNMQIPDLDAFIGSLSPANQAKAAIAMGKVQEGLGELAAQYMNVGYIGVE